MESNPLASTFYGTSSYDQAYFVQIDEDDLIYIFGQTEGNLEVTDGVFNNTPNAGQFVACFDTQLQNLEWNTRVGNSGGNDGIEISPTAFLVSECGQIYMSGWGGTTKFGKHQMAQNRVFPRHLMHTKGLLTEVIFGLEYSTQEPKNLYMDRFLEV